MIEITDKSKCCGCHACASACPKKCISMMADEEGFLFPKVDKNLCINCHICEKVCPIKQKAIAQQKPIAYFGFNKDKHIQLESSSGGIFTLLAQAILADGGVVFGAAFNSNFEVEHICVDNEEDLQKLRGSKYVQSRIGKTYIEAKNFLDQGRKVLFTGTPCQIEGLHTFLRKEYDNLFTQDFICHGVPSPLVWNKYKNDQILKYNSKLKQVSFRDKSKSWQKFGMKLTFENGTTYFSTHNQDKMFDAFLKNKCLRISCYSCVFKTEKRNADITLADYWGASLASPCKYSKDGTSIILINSSKGGLLFDKIKDKITFHKAKISTVKMFNPAFTHSVKMPKSRQEYMKEIIAATNAGGGY